jgi:hypothetical protein
VTTSSRGENGGLQITEIRFPGFDISWAGCPPRLPQYWFGSDDGRILVTTDLNSGEGARPLLAAPSGEAVNGIAWAPGLVAASTRSEVVLLYPESDSVELRFSRGVFPGGAHGVARTPSGRIVAPMGRQGLLMVGPNEIIRQQVQVIRPPDDSLNLYRVVCVASHGHGEVFACAARRSGFLAMPLLGDELGDTGRSLQSANEDFVDVASLNMKDHPSAVAILSVDCSITLVRDLVADNSTVQTLHYSFTGERAYRILCADGHVFLLTNRRLYAFVDLVSRFLEGEGMEKQVTIHAWDIEAVDASLGANRSLLVVMPDCVYRIEIDSLINGPALLPDNRGVNGQRVNATGPDFVTTDAMESFENPPWEHSEHGTPALSQVTAS